MREIDTPKPIGAFILEQTDIKPTMLPDGGYYHYTQVCTMLERIKSNEPTIITVTGCHDCPMRRLEIPCAHPDNVYTVDPFTTCPLKEKGILVGLGETSNLELSK